jgi:hypothetical protein
VRTLGRITGILAVASAAALHANAQGYPDPATYPGSLTIESGLYRAADLPYAHPGDAPTATEMREAKAFNARVLEILQRNPAAASPRGYTLFARPTVTNHAPGSNPTVPFYFGFRIIWNWWGYWDASESRMVHEGALPFTQIFNIYANHLYCLFGSPPEVGADTVGTFYKEPRHARDVTGIDLYWPPQSSGRCAVVTNVKKPLWVPISRERYLTTLIARARSWRRESAENLRTNSPRAQQEANKNLGAELQKSMLAACEATRSANPGGYAECVRTAKTAKKTMDSAFAAVVADKALNASIASADTIGSGMLHELESQLASLTPMERAGPAVVWLDDQHDALPWSFLVRRGDNEATDSLTTRMVVPNPDFFDRTLPRSAPQVITVEIDRPPSVVVREGDVDRYGQETLDYELKYAKTIRALLDGLDWGALKALLSP